MVDKPLFLIVIIGTIFLNIGTLNTIFRECALYPKLVMCVLDLIINTFAITLTIIFLDQNK